MSDRYAIMDASGADAIGVPEVAIPMSDWETEYDCLVDTKRNTLVWQDYRVSDAPEDMYLYRNLRVFVTELNRLSEELRGEIEAVLMHGRDYLALMTPENRALLVEALDNLEAVTR